MEHKENLLILTKTYLKSLISEVTNISIKDNISSTPFQELGIDSFHVLQIIKKLEEVFGTLPKTLLFENFNINDLSHYFVDKYESTLTGKFGEMEQIPNRIFQTTQRSLGSVNVISEKGFNSEMETLPESPILVLEKDIYKHSKLKDLVQNIFNLYKNEGSVSRGTRNIAPNLFIGSSKQGYFNYSRYKNIILVYAYTGPQNYLPIIAYEIYNYCIKNSLELNIFSPKPIETIGGIPFSATPFGVVQRILNLQNFTLQGGRMRRLRYLVGKFQNTGECRFEEYQNGSSKEIDNNIANIIDQWCAPRTMVNPLIHIVKYEILAGNLKREHRLFLTYLDDVLQNVILISKMSSEENGYLMDLEFYPPDMPLGGLEFAIVRIIELLATEGCDILSLGGTYGCKLAPSSNADPELDKTLDYLREQNIFNDGGNFQFKNKFRTENVPIFLCRPIGNSNPDNVTDIIMMVADPQKMQTSDEEHHTLSRSQQLIITSEKDVQNKPGVYYNSEALSIDSVSSEDFIIEGEVRSEVLSEFNYNPLNIPNSKIEIDLKTDSWAQLEMPVIHNYIKYLRSQILQSVSINESLSSIFPFSYFSLTTSGRMAEHAFFKAWHKKGSVPQNLLFPTTIFHQIDNGFVIKELPHPEIFNLNSEEIYKGNLNWDLFYKQVKEDPNSVAFVLIELSNNAVGGAPISIQHLKKIKVLLSDHSIPLVIDGTRIMENAQHILENEKEFTNTNIWSVVREILSYADAAILSLAKDFCVNKGGVIATNNIDLYNKVQDIIEEESIGLDLFEKKVIAQSIQNRAKIENLILHRIESVHSIGNTLKKHFIPIVQPVGGHCILIDPKQISLFNQFEYPVESFLAWMFLNTGIRAGSHSVGMQKNTPVNGLVRLAIPVGLKRKQVEEIIHRLISLFDKMENIPEVLLDCNQSKSFGDMYAKFKLKKYHNISKKLLPKSEGSNSPDQNNPNKSFSSNLTSFSKRTEQSQSKNIELLYQFQDIAIVGMAGRYPKAKNLNELWKNLLQGKDCIETIPDFRFEQRLHNEFSRKYRGGFIDDVDKFDSLFFNISPREAEMMDPQERLFLEVAWEAIEDAGYYPEVLSQENGSRNIGVFVGAVWTMYQMIGVEEKLSGNYVSPNSFLWSIANRISYWMNFTGESLTLDTACSSSLTALYMACESIYKGNCSAAIVGGVNLDLHQGKWDIDWAGGSGALSVDGVCRTFGKGANGYVPGEGVGAIFIKPLDRAVNDNDNIYGVIKSVAINHGGKTSGYLVPSPQSQTRLIQSALDKASIDARTIGYVEAHGTGTELGDPIEILGLTNAFQSSKVKSQSCPVGSIKTNIGHLEAAAGIVGIQKVLLQMKYHQLVPSLHSSELNDFIDFKNSPFYVVQNLEKWKEKEINEMQIPLRAGISSFGAGGSNAHVIIENYEYLTQLKKEETSQLKLQLFPLSARNEDQLREMADRLRKYIQSDSQMQLVLNNIAYTLQLGRKSFDLRLVILARTKDELIEKLTCFIDHIKDKNILIGRKQNAEEVTNLLDSKEKEEFISIISQNRDLHKQAQLWIDGFTDNWQDFQDREPGKRVSLPTYPFADKRHWAVKRKKTDMLQASSQMEKNIRQEQCILDTPKEEFSKLHYYYQWEHTPIDKEIGSQNTIDTVLFFCMDDKLCDIYQNLKYRINNANNIILVQPGDKYQYLGQQKYSINLCDINDYVKLFESLNQNKFPLGKVCFLCPDSTFFYEDLHVNEDMCLKDILQNSVYSLLNFCQALISQELKNKIQLIYLYLGKKNVPQPHNDAINGFIKSLQVENTKFKCKVLEIQQDRINLDRITDIILAEFHSPFAQHVCTVRYESSQRFVKILKRLNPEDINNFSDQNIKLKEKGVYIITGGAGGLGLIFAEFLARHYRARLILTGRSKHLTNENKLEQLRKMGAEILYIPADISIKRDVRCLIDRAKDDFGQINGIIHAAGVLRDSFIKNKTQKEMEAVLAPKIYGTLYLDKETEDEQLDFFVMFSSLAAVGGNAGQCDYSYANHFMDTFALNRELLKEKGKRFGKTLSINWSLWADGGMKLDEQTEIFFKRNLGIKPLSKDFGIETFVNGLSFEKCQISVLEGVEEKIEQAWGLREQTFSKPIFESSASKSEDYEITSNEIVALIENDLSQIVVDLLKMDAEDVNPDQILLDLGFDSIGMTAFANAVNERYQLEITPVLFFEFPTIKDIAKCLFDDYKDEILKSYLNTNVPVNKEILEAGHTAESINSENTSKFEKQENAFEQRFVNIPIAIVGISGVLPQSDNLEEFWGNLLSGRNMVTVIPRDRWKWEDYAGDPTKEVNKTYSKWGGFMKDVDKFDPLFFGISPREAEVMDPQQRIFLETVWRTIEDSGHKVSELSGTRTGLFVGASYRDYTDLLIKSDIVLDGYSATGNTLSILVNRISYLLNLHGPSAPIDTACSSSLIAIHRAIESIHTGSCEMAIAGGIQVILTPAAQISLASAGMLSKDGKCKTFDKNADGYVRGEGSGAVFLKPLLKAEADGDHIYAVIKSTTENHGGRVTTLTAPNPNAQAELIIEAYEKARIDPATVGYIECHGTGTSLGDPIEIKGLKKAFSELYKKYDRTFTDKPHCGLGAVKSNIGHLEIAAGIAGVFKVLLAMKYKKIPASLHFNEMNPYINLSGSPFFIIDKTISWDPIKDKNGNSFPRRAGISSFGFGGSNAHIVLEEYAVQPKQSYEDFVEPYLVILSAKNNDRLKAYAQLILSFIQEQEINLVDLAYTLQVGRDPMKKRLGVLVNSVDQLVEKLNAYINDEPDIEDLYLSEDSELLSDDETMIERSFTNNDFSKLLQIWTKGIDIDWNKLYGSFKPKRVSLPTYPFAREKYWFNANNETDKENKLQSEEISSLLDLVYNPISNTLVENLSNDLSNKFGKLLDKIY